MYRHGYSDTSTHNIWLTMLARCENPRAPKYKWYGARGITVCERWHTFEHFLADMGERPAGLTLDREDPTKGYEPSNCRWATHATQRRNRSDVKLEPHEPAQIRWLKQTGQSAQHIAKFFALNKATVYRIVAGTVYAE